MNVNAHYLFLKIGIIFGLVPYMNYKKNNSFIKTVIKVYPIAIEGVLFIACVLEEKKQLSYMIYIVLSFVTIASLTSTSYTKKRFWSKWIKLYEITNTVDLRENRSLRCDWALIIKFLQYLAVDSFMQIFYSFSSGHFKIFIGLRAYMKLTTQYLPIIFCNILCKRFEYLNGCLELLRREHIAVSVLKRTKTKPSFYKSFYKNLFVMTVCFNKLFGWFLALWILELLISVCMFLNFTMKEELDYITIFMFTSFVVLESVSIFILFINKITNDICNIDL